MTGAFVVGMVGLVGCEDSENMVSLTIQPQITTLSTNGYETVDLTVTDGLREHSMPLTWRVSEGVGRIDHGLGFCSYKISLEQAYSRSELRPCAQILCMPQHVPVKSRDDIWAALWVESNMSGKQKRVKMDDMGNSHNVPLHIHIHLDEHDCLEVIVLRGRVSEINKMAENIISLKGVKLGHINLVAAESAHSHSS